MILAGKSLELRGLNVFLGRQESTFTRLVSPSVNDGNLSDDQRVSIPPKKYGRTHDYLTLENLLAVMCEKGLSAIRSVRLRFERLVETG